MCFPNAPLPPTPGPWLRLERLSIKIMNRTGDKAGPPESSVHWEQVWTGERHPVCRWKSDTGGVVPTCFAFDPVCPKADVGV